MNQSGSNAGDPVAAPDPQHTPARFRLSTYDYDLPRELIAQAPAARRDQARLLVLNEKSDGILHRAFHQIPSLLRPSDLLVLNESRVIPASLIGRKAVTGGRVEILVLNPAESSGKDRDNSDHAERVCMVSAAKPLREGAVIVIDSGLKLTALRAVAPGRWRIRFPVAEPDFLSLLEEHGRPPLPPYIRGEGRDPERDKERYQTIYARSPGSVAAPTAGLHFTKNLLDQLVDRGVEIERILLHVGPGTFTPVRDPDIRDHKMEDEFYEIPERVARGIRCASQEGRRIIAVGTTTVRALESAARRQGPFCSRKERTDLFMSPGYTFRVVDGMITNFHLPRSTLLMLVCAFAGTDRILGAYKDAVRARYRFYSYGDACLIIR